MLATRSRLLVAATCFVGLIVGCNSDAPRLVRGAVCTGANVPLACRQPCNPSVSCPSGFYCGSDGSCTADCGPVGPNCTEGYRCREDGFCTPSRGDAGDDSNTCATINLGATRSTPNIMLLVDRSGSMDDDLVNTNADTKDEESRWEAFSRSVLAPDGPIATLEGAVRFGMTFYTANKIVKCGDGACPESSCLGQKNQCSSDLSCMRCPSPSCLSEGTSQTSNIIRTAPDLNQYAALKKMMSDYGPYDATPTGDAITFLEPDLAAMALATGEPTLLIIATDGEPDRCEDSRRSSDFGLNTIFDKPNVTDGMEEALLATRDAFDSGIQTFIMSVGSGEIATSHLQQMANVGVGLAQNEPAATQAPYYAAEDTDALSAAIQSIVGAAVTCSLQLSKPIKAETACSGTLTYNGVALPCEPADGNGWFPSMPDGEGNTATIELRGTACDALKQDGGVVSGVFPCNVVVVD